MQKSNTFHDFLIFRESRSPKTLRSCKEYVYLHFCDSRSRTARNLALDCSFLVLFAALLARGRPEFDLDYLFKAKKCNTS